MAERSCGPIIQRSCVQVPATSVTHQPAGWKCSRRISRRDEGAALRCRGRRINQRDESEALRPGWQHIDRQSEKQNTTKTF
eukprot:1686157-Amphidinium_carterae.4